jgi:uncharacterized protein (TIGR03435 family)
MLRFRLVCLAAVAVATAADRPRFEVASVKPTQSMRYCSGGAGVGGASEHCSTVRFLLWFSYGVQPFQIVGGPGWIDTDHFDIEARSEDRNAGPDQIKLMLQSLLEDRFQLKLHRETRQSPVYELVVAKGGPKIRLSPDQTSPDVNGPAPKALRFLIAARFDSVSERLSAMPRRCHFFLRCFRSGWMETRSRRNAHRRAGRA